MDTKNTVAATSGSRQALAMDNEDNLDDAPTPVTPSKVNTIKEKDTSIETGWQGKWRRWKKT